MDKSMKVIGPLPVDVFIENISEIDNYQLTFLFRELSKLEQYYLSKHQEDVVKKINIELFRCEKEIKRRLSKNRKVKTDNETK